MHRFYCCSCDDFCISSKRCLPPPGSLLETAESIFIRFGGDMLRRQLSGNRMEVSHKSSVQ